MESVIVGNGAASWLLFCSATHLQYPICEERKLCRTLKLPNSLWNTSGSVQAIEALVSTHPRRNHDSSATV